MIPAADMAPIAASLRWFLRPLPMLESLQQKHGHVFSLRIPRLPQPLVFFAEPAAVKDIWNSDPEELRAGESNLVLKSVLGESSLLLLDGARHLRERRMMLPPFHGDRMKAYGVAMREATRREIARWQVGAPFAMQEAMQTVTLDVIMQTILGAGDAELRDALVRWTTLGTSPLGTALLLLTPPDRFEQVQALTKGRFGKLMPWAKITRAQDDADRLVRGLIARRRSEAPREDVLSMLMAARDEHGAALSDSALRDEMLTLLLAGHETTATTLAWTVHHLLNDRGWLARIQAELAEVVGAGPVELEHLDRLVLLDAAIKETLRLTPIIMMVGRHLRTDARIGDHDLKAGMHAMACIYLVHRRADLWPEPTRFDPSRFVGKKPDPTHYFPFGGGTRRCLGMAFASYEMKIVLATILSSVSLAPAPGKPVKLVRRGITMAPSGGMPVVVTRRA